MLNADIRTKLVLRFAPQQRAGPDALVASGSLFWLSFVRQEFNYNVDFLPAAFLLGFSFAMGVVSLTLTAVKGVGAQEIYLMSGDVRQAGAVIVDLRTSQQTFVVAQGPRAQRAAGRMAGLM